MNLSKEKRLLKKQWQALSNKADAIVAAMARKILVEHPHLDEFIMGMGICHFTVKGQEYESVGTEDFAYMKPLDDFICEWDEYLKMTGTPMRFTATGPLRSDW